MCQALCLKLQELREEKQVLAFKELPNLGHSLGDRCSDQGVPRMLWEHRKRAPDKHWGGGREEETQKGFPKEIIAEVSLVKPASLWRERGRECGCISIYSYHKDTRGLRHKDRFWG